MASALVQAFIVLTLALSLTVCVAKYPWPDDVKQAKGYITLNSTAGVHYFYWFFESRHDPSSDPLLLWLTGGPGCSSELALFLENGPFIINGTSEPTFNPYGWNSFTNLIYVDQPQGTGFSYVDNPSAYVTSEKQVAADMLEFLSIFFSKYPYSNQDLYIFGESYGGHYVPAIAQFIIDSSLDWTKNFKGIGIGNGWTDPDIQYSQYGPFAFNVGIIDNDTLQKTKTMYKTCHDLLEKQNWEKAYQYCENIEGLVTLAASKKLGRSINPYNYKQPCDPPPLCSDMTNLTKFLNRDDIRHELGVGAKKWIPCSSKVEQHLVADWVKDFHNAVANVLDKGLKVLVYSGKLDFICNYFGGRAWTNATQWSGQEEFQKAPYQDWNVNGVLAGEFKAHMQLTFLEVKDGTHQVPMTLPHQALDLLDRFVHNKPFA